MQQEKDLLDRIIPLDEMGRVSKVLRNGGKRIVTLNGSFDLLHAGHLHIIKEAAEQGDILVVGLNSDASIKQYKSVDRPIISLTYRMQMMAAIRYVDYVTWFEETTPFHFIETIHPDVHVNGSEYGENCIEAALVKGIGARLHIVQLVEGLSTSNILQKL